MTKQELLRIMRLLSALESAMFAMQVRVPDHLVLEVNEAIEILEQEILKP